MKGTDHREHQEDGEQEQRDRRDEAGALAVDVAAGELARAPGQHRQGAPDLAFEVEHAVQQVVPEGAERAVDMALLPAGVAIVADQRRAAIEAARSVVWPLASMPVRGSTARAASPPVTASAIGSIRRSWRLLPRGGEWQSGAARC
jgi:hypothetical protein